MAFSVMPTEDESRAEVEMKTAKQEVQELLDSLPDEASLEDIQYHIYVRQKVQKGLAAAAAGATIPHEEVARRMTRWLGQ